MIGDPAVIAVGSVEIRNIPADTLVAGDPVRIIQKQSGTKNETNLILFRFLLVKSFF